MSNPPLSPETLTFTTELAIKIFPIFISLVLALVKVQEEIIKHTLKNYSNICKGMNVLKNDIPDETGKDVVELVGTKLDQINCIQPLSKESTKIQSIIGLGVTMVISLTLSKSTTFTAAVFILFGALLFIAIKTTGTPPKGAIVKGGGIGWSILCLIFGLILTICSYISL